MPDKNQIISEVAARNGIRIEPNDPLFAVATITQLALEESLQNAEERLRAIVGEFETNVQALEHRVGKTLALETKSWIGDVRRGLQNEITSAGRKVRELIQTVHEAHARPRMIFWASVGLLCALGLFCSGVWFGRLTSVR